MFLPLGKLVFISTLGPLGTWTEGRIGDTKLLSLVPGGQSPINSHVCVEVGSSRKCLGGTW